MPFMDPTLGDALRAGAARLADAAVPNAALDARVLLRHVLNLTPEALYTELERPMPEEAQAGYHELITHRAAGEPVAYLTGRREFYGLSLRVTPDVLIPRPETELLVERAMALLPRGARAVDVGTGSGAIAVAVAAHRPDVAVIAIDRSLAACRIARQNSEEQRVAARVGVVQSDLLAALAITPDALLANLPYVPEPELPALQPEVQREPRLALAAGPDGLDLYRRLFADLAPRHTTPAVVLCEHAPYQAGAMLALCRAALPAHRCTVLPDMAGRPRLLEAVR